jgi:hypothetical protein
MDRTKRAMVFTETAEKMLLDPALTGDLLALGLALAFTTSWPRARAHLGWNPQKLRSVVRRDVLRYEPPAPDRACPAPMVRRQGLCGKRTLGFAWLVDPDTGQRTPVQFCRRHEHLGDEPARRRAWEQWRANGEPQPPANTGGVLAGYLSCDWEAVYDWADPTRKRPGTPVPRPALTLIQGGRQQSRGEGTTLELVQGGDAGNVIISVIGVSGS